MGDKPKRDQTRAIKVMPEHGGIPAGWIKSVDRACDAFFLRKGISRMAEFRSRCGRPKKAAEGDAEG